MKKFSLKLLKYGLILSVIPLIELFLPPTYLAFRHYSAIQFSCFPSITPYYQNVSSFMEEEGDLCSRTKHAIKKEVTWITDKYGFRNEKIPKSSKIVILGDSFTQGSGMDQRNTISAKLNQKLEIDTVYNCAPFELSNLLYLIDHGLLSKPELVIYENVERISPTKLIVKSDTSGQAALKVNVQKSLKKYGLDKLIDRLVRLRLIRRAKAILKHWLHNPPPAGVQSPLDKSIFFLRGSSVLDTQPDKDEVKKTILNYKAELDRRGIRFLYVPQPNKETVYWRYVPLQGQPMYLFELLNELDSMGVDCINVLPIYNENFSIDIYQKDDTHWNELAINLTADAIDQWLRSNTNYKSVTISHHY